ncbi:MAG TPA: MFS transporter, partial [Polyangiaceae bacterium]
IANAVSFAAVLVSLASIRKEELHAQRRKGPRAKLVEGFRYVAGRPDLQVVLFMLFVYGTFGLNFPIFISTMSVGAFHRGAREYGLLTSSMAIGSVAGALLSARREKPSVRLLVIGAFVFGGGLTLAAAMPTFATFAIALVLVGVAAQTFTTTANGTVQLSTEPGMRGRVMAMFLAITLGGTPVGAPLVGWVADRYGPRWSLGVGAMAGMVAALTGLVYLARRR